MKLKFNFLLFAVGLLLPMFAQAQTPVPAFNPDPRFLPLWSNDKRTSTDTFAIPRNLSFTTGINWENYDSLNAVWSTYQLNSGTPGNGTRHAFLRAYDTVYASSGATLTLNNVQIDSGSIFYSKAIVPTSDAGLRMGGTATGTDIFDSSLIINNGQIGLSIANYMRIDINKDSVNYRFTGKSTYNMSRVKFSATKTSRIKVVFDADFNLNYPGTTTSSANYTISNFANSSSVNSAIDSIVYTINSGKTMTLSDSSVFHMVNASTSVKGGVYIYNINGTLDYSKTTRLSALVPTDTTSSVLLLNIAGNMKMGHNTVIGDTTSTKGKVLLHVLGTGRVTVGLDTALIIRNNVVFRLDTTASFRRAVGFLSPTVADLFPVALADNGNNSVTLTNAGTADTFSVKLKNTFDALFPTADTTKMVRRQWTLGESVLGGSNLTVQLNWLAADQATNFNPATATSVFVYTGARWKQYAAVVAGAGTVASPYSATITGVDSFQYFVVGAAYPTPVVQEVGVLTAFAQALIGVPSAVQSFTVAAYPLTAPLTITAPTDYQVSLSAAGPFTSSVTVAAPGGSIYTTQIYVRLNSSIPGAHNGNIAITGTNVTTVNVPVTGSTATPIIIVNPTTLNAFVQFVGTPSPAQTVTVTGSSLGAAGITVTAPANFQDSVSGGTWGTTLVIPAVGGNASATVYFRLNAAAVGTYSGNITLTTSGASAVTIPVTGTTGTPTITETGTLSAFTHVTGQPSAIQQFMVAGGFLVNPITITAPAGFEIAVATVTPVFSASITLPVTNFTLATTTIYIRMTAASVGTYTGNLTLTSGTAPAVIIPVTGTTISPAINAIDTLTPFMQIIGAPSAYQMFTVSGSNLSCNLIVTAPAGFEISRDLGAHWESADTLTSTFGLVNPFTFYLRLNAAAPGNYNGTVTLTGCGANNVYIPVNGTTVAPVVIALVNPPLTTFHQAMPAASAFQGFTVSGAYLGNCPVTVTPPAGYQISLDNGATWSSGPVTITPDANGNVANIAILVRLNATTAGSYSGNIAISSCNAATQYVAVNGTNVTTGIKQVSKDVFSVYPNPVTAQLTIVHELPKDGTIITVWNTTGSKVIEIAPQANTKQTQLDMSGLASGSYFIMLSNGTDKYSTNVIKK